MLSEAKYEAKRGKGRKILSPKQILQRLPIAHTQEKAGNISENLLNGIRQIMFFISSKKITKKVYNNIKTSINLQNKMDTLFMNS